VAFSPDGEYVAGGGYDGNVAVWKVADPKQPVKLFNASPGYVPPKAAEPAKK
jgi:WD40 repeat protein